jgi:hypothetical protein
MAVVADRVLAAVRFVDQATGATVPTALVVRSQAALGVQNRSGLWVVRAAESVPADPEQIAPGSITVEAEVSAAGSPYLARAFSLNLPRALAGADSVFEAEDVVLPPSPVTPLRSTWAAVYFSVAFAADASHPQVTPLEGALVRLRHGTELTCMSLTNDLGEAVVIAPRVPMFSAAADDSTIIDISVTHDVDVVVDVAQVDAATGRRRRLADPDDIWLRRAQLVQRSVQVALAPGQQVSRGVLLPRS